MNYLKLLSISMVLVTCSAMGAETVKIFESSRTENGPELNVIVYNETSKPLDISISFGVNGIDPSQLNSNCTLKAQLRPISSSAADLTQIYGAFEREQTFAKISPKSFAFRYYPIFSREIVPCVASVLITDLSNNLSKVYQTNISIPEVSLPKVSANYYAEYSSENTTQDIVRTTLLLKSKEKEFSAIRVTKKSLVDCDGDISDGLIRQGMDGAFVLLPPEGIAAITTALHMRIRGDSDKLKNCRLRFHIQDVLTGKTRILQVPVRIAGLYEVAPVSFAH